MGAAKKSLLRRAGRRQEGGPGHPPGDGADVRAPGRGLHHWLQEQQKAIQSFNRALEIDPGIQLSKGIATSEVNEAFAAAKRERGGGWRGETAPPPGKKRKGPVMESGDEAAAAPKKKAPREEKSSPSDDDSEEKDLPVKIQALDCPNEDEAIIDKAATLRCAVAPSLPVAKVFLVQQEHLGDGQVRRHRAAQRRRLVDDRLVLVRAVEGLDLDRKVLLLGVVVRGRGLLLARRPLLRGGGRFVAALHHRTLALLARRRRRLPPPPPPRSRLAAANASLTSVVAIPFDSWIPGSISSARLKLWSAFRGS